MSNLVAKVGKILQRMLFARADDAIRIKVVAIGSNGCERYLEYNHYENY